MKLSKLFDQDFDLIFSLGENCSVAHYLQRFKLRDMSSPFDWLCMATLQTRIDLLINGFSGFLEKENLNKIFVPSCGDHYNDSYCDEKLGFYFLHDFPKGQSIDDSFGEVKEKYNRRIDRLLKRIPRSRKVLLVWAGFDGPIADEEFVGVLQKLKDAYPGVEFYLLVIENDLALRKVEERVCGLSPNIICFKGPFRPVPELTWGDKSLWNLVVSRINRTFLPYYYCIKQFIYKRIKGQKRTTHYLFCIPIVWHKRGR